MSSAESSSQIEKLLKNSAQLLEQVECVSGIQCSVTSYSTFLKIVWNIHTYSQILQKESRLCTCVGVVQVQLPDNSN